MKKGVFYTLGLSLLMLVLLSLALVFFRQAEYAESRHVELSFFQKMADVDRSIQQIFAEAYSRESDIVFSSSYSSLRFEESLPRNLTTLDNLVTSLKGDIENDFTMVNITLGSFPVTHDLIFRPLDIAYQHNGSNIQVAPNLKINDYNIILTFTNNISSCTDTLGPGGTADITFVGVAPGPDCTKSRSDADGEITLDVSGDSVTIAIGENGTLTIESNAAAQSNITIGFNAINEAGYFELPILIELFDTGFDFYKQGYPRLPLLP